MLKKNKVNTKWRGVIVRNYPNFAQLAKIVSLLPIVALLGSCASQGEPTNAIEPRIASLKPGDAIPNDPQIDRNMVNIVLVLSNSTEFAMQELYESGLRNFESRARAGNYTDIASLVLDFSSGDPRSAQSGNSGEYKPVYQSLFQARSSIEELNSEIQRIVSTRIDATDDQDSIIRVRDELEKQIFTATDSIFGIIDDLQNDYQITTGVIIGRALGVYGTNTVESSTIVDNLLSENDFALRSLGLLESIASLYRELPSVFLAAQPALTDSQPNYTRLEIYYARIAQLRDQAGDLQVKTEYDGGSVTESQ